MNNRKERRKEGKGKGGEGRRGWQEEKGRGEGKKGREGGWLVANASRNEEYLN